jgi:hypothetical protein
MIGVSLFLAVAVLLFLLLFFVGRGAESTGELISRPDDQIRHGYQDTLYSPELARRIFSPEDRKFISSTGSPQLLRIYGEERRGVALHWVRQTSNEIRTVMREHALTARQSENLEVTGEAKLFFQYIELRSICGLLAIFVRLLSPHVLCDLAAYASKLSYQIGRAQQDLANAAQLATFRSPGAP